MAGTRPGLEAQDKNGNWHKISTDPGTIIVNVGDMLKEASGGYYPSTTHRVVNPSNNVKNDTAILCPYFCTLEMMSSYPKIIQQDLI